MSRESVPYLSIHMVFQRYLRVLLSSSIPEAEKRIQQDFHASENDKPAFHIIKYFLMITLNGF